MDAVLRELLSDAAGEDLATALERPLPADGHRDGLKLIFSSSLCLLQMATGIDKLCAIKFQFVLEWKQQLQKNQDRVFFIKK